MSEISALTDYSYLTDGTSSSKVQNTLSKDYSDSTNEELLDACKEFEAYFVEQMFKGMEKAYLGDEDSSDYASQMKDYATDSLYTEYSKMISDQGSLGLAQKLYEQMSREYSL